MTLGCTGVRLGGRVLASRCLGRVLKAGMRMLVIADFISYAASELAWPY